MNRKKAAALEAGLDFEEIQLPDTVQMPEMLSTIKGVVHQIVSPILNSKWEDFLMNIHYDFFSTGKLTRKAVLDQ